MRRAIILAAAAMLFAATPSVAAPPPPPEVPFSVTPTAAPFGSLCLGLTKVVGFAVTNTSTAGSPVDIDVTAIGSDNPSEFEATIPALPKTLNHGETLTFTVKFKPSSRGARAATITVTAERTDDSGSPRDVKASATGTGVDRQISVAPGSFAFGGTQIGKSSAPRYVTIFNGGGDPLTVSSLKVTGSDAKDFSHTPGSPISIGRGSGKTVAITFKPSVIGSRTASLVIVSNSCNQPSTRNVTLSGRGTHGEIEVSPSTVTLETQPKKQSDPATVTIKNVGEAPLTVTSIKITGERADQFQLQVVPALPATVDAREQITFDVVFRPTKKSLPPPTATVEIASDDTETPLVKMELKTSWASPSPSPSPSPSLTPSPSPSPSESASVIAAPVKSGGGPGSVGDYVSVVVVGGGVSGMFGMLFVIRSLKRRRVLERWRSEAG